MPADRLLHPRLGHSEKVARLTDFEYRIWTQYMLSADDYGVMRCSAVTLQADNDALHAKRQAVVQRALEFLINVGLIGAFEHQGRRYVYQADWQDWQHVGYPRGTVNPLPPPDALATCSLKTRELFARHPTNISQTLAEHLPKISETLGKSSTSSRARETANGKRLTAKANGNGPIFDGERLAIFGWQVERCQRLLGEHAEAFDLHAWFFKLDEDARMNGLVIPDRGAWPWLQQQLVAEAQRRGLPLQMATTETDDEARWREFGAKGPSKRP